MTQLLLSADGHAVGILGLDTVLEGLLALGREPDKVSDTELLDAVRAARNYIPPRAEVEARYAAFHGRRRRGAGT